MKILIVEARFYEDIADALFDGAKAVLDKAGVPYDRVTVPGALEIPAAISLAMGNPRCPYTGFVALGCVIRGETSHYDYVCGESARGLMDLSLKDKAVVTNGIITVEDADQAWARASQDKKDKGGFAAQACLDMIALKAKLQG